MCNIQRGWVNAPSSLQGAHPHHGKRVLVNRDGFKDNISGHETCEVWFLEGERQCTRVEYRCIALGWPDSVNATR
jgi:hypothetical protein